MDHQEGMHTVHEGVSFPVAVAIGGVVIATSLFLGGMLVYFLQNAAFEAREDVLEREIVRLSADVEDAERVDPVRDVMPESSYDFLADVDFPVVVYGRAGLLNSTEEGRAEKRVLEQKLVEPYIDYHNEEGIDLIALRILVPVEVGEAYSMLGIFGDGVVEELLFGAREGEYDYWEPVCMGECEYSDAFREKYPEIVGE